MSHYKPYPFYKDSGVEWLGQMPAHWDVTRVQNAFRNILLCLLTIPAVALADGEPAGCAETALRRCGGDGVFELLAV